MVGHERVVVSCELEQKLPHCAWATPVAHARLLDARLFGVFYVLGTGVH
jgi:hypothetical protein